MFTVLYRDTDGSETLYEVDSVKRLCADDADPSIPPMGGLALFGVKAVDIPEGATVKLPMGCDDTGRGFARMAFVMNRFGSTVARYS